MKLSAKRENPRNTPETWASYSLYFFFLGIKGRDAIGNAIVSISPAKAVDETFVRGELLAEIEGANGRTELHAPCAGVVKGINPMIENPYDMQPNQVWVYKCHLKRDQLGNLMSEQEYAQAIQ